MLVVLVGLVVLVVLVGVVLVGVMMVLVVGVGDDGGDDGGGGASSPSQSRPHRARTITMLTADYDINEIEPKPLSHPCLVSASLPPPSLSLDRGNPERTIPIEERIYCRR